MFMLLAFCLCCWALTLSTCVSRRKEPHLYLFCSLPQTHTHTDRAQARPRCCVKANRTREDSSDPLQSTQTSSCMHRRHAQTNACCWRLNWIWHELLWISIQAGLKAFISKGLSFCYANTFIKQVLKLMKNIFLNITLNIPFWPCFSFLLFILCFF